MAKNSFSESAALSQTQSQPKFLINREKAWQMAAGEPGRFYSDIFLKHDVMFLGPGHFGKYTADTYRDAVKAGSAKSKIVGNIASFHDDVRPGEIVLMRKGRRVEAIGVVASDYDWDETFDDIYGWDLQHFRRVIWQEHLEKDLKQIQAKAPLWCAQQQQTFTRVKVENVLEKLRPLFTSIKERELKPKPKLLPKLLSLDEVGQQLFGHGVANNAVDKVIATIERQRRLLAWYNQFGNESKRPSEHELVAHIVLPLLIALGWSEQLLAVEWQKIDLAAFWKTPTTPETCVLICEAKKRGRGLQDVLKQAIDYVKKQKLNECRKVLLTDGGRFYLYERELNDYKVAGYLNVDKIRNEHIASPGTNAVDTIVALTPAAASRNIA
jgi:hypothetical protein